MLPNELTSCHYFTELSYNYRGQLVYEAHTYSCHSRNVPRCMAFWRCSFHKKLGCKAALTTKRKAITGLRGSHNHAAPQPLKTFIPRRVPVPRVSIKQLLPEARAVKRRPTTISLSISPVKSIAHVVEPVRAKLNLSNPENILRTSSNQHNFVFVGVPRMKGKCVTCLKKGKSDLQRLSTCCDSCPGSNWMCEPCFEELH
ncbi:hypothetical protein AWZ03_008941 [Drosophila navojoa]|uniref:FLYWCH-type domain-containing protein n=1 Tax=Drosophila navojoa TaxID=7232 RepID=A0A484B9B2_DRONA|nr:hypothetical protein AWZ03_008941 [Drosophila navojoa]